MSSREIVLWLDERWYAALEKRLRDETLPEKLEDMLDELINKLIPAAEYDRIDSEIHKEREQIAAQREADRRFAVFRVTERGEQSVFLLDEPFEVLNTARSLRHYTRKGDPNADFRHYYAAAQDITVQEFEQYTGERMEGTGRVVGAFDIDLDAGTFATLDVADGWQTFSVKDVCSAAYQADLRSGESPDERTERLLDYLRGRELTSQEQPSPGMGMAPTMC